MTDCFLKIFNISVTASYLVVAVLLLRLILKKAPKWSICLLWGIVALRLVMPFSFESKLSLVPSANTVVVSNTADAPFEVNTGVSAVDTEINDIIIENKDSINNINQSISGAVTSNNDSAPDLNPDTTENLSSQNSVESKKIKVSIFTVFGLVWLLGIATMLIYSAISYAIVRKKVKVSLHYRDNIYFCDNVDTSFILGIFRPRIYIQSDMTQQNTDYVIKHECAHLKRCDHLIKPFAFLLLSVYWFNPLVWVSYILLCRDIESACDERVVKDAADIDIKGYSTALLNCGTKRRVIIACPVAFGEVSVKSRIRAVLKYKRPPRYLCVMAVVLSVAVSVCFLTDPIQKVDALSEVIEYETVVEYINRTQNDTADNGNKQNNLFNNILSVFKGDNNSNANTSSTNSTISQGNNSNNYADVNVNGFDDLFKPDVNISDNNYWTSDNSTNNTTQGATSTVVPPNDNSSQKDQTTSEETVSNPNKTVISSSVYVYNYNSNVNAQIQDWFVQGDNVHMLLNNTIDRTYSYVIFDSNIGSITFEKDTRMKSGEMNCFGNEIWISYPELKGIVIYDKETFVEKETIHLDTEVYSFDIYNDYLIYSDCGQSVRVYRYNLKNGKKMTFSYLEYQNSFYKPDVLVNDEYGLVYISESSVGGSELFCYDIETMSLKQKYSPPLGSIEDYGYPNGQRKSFLNDGFLYWGAFKIDPLNITNIVSSYGKNLDATKEYDGMIQVTDRYVVMESGIYDKVTCKQVLLWLGTNQTPRYASMITESGNIIGASLNGLRVVIDGL